MRIFENPKAGKINFVDENDVYVGMSYSELCCENFGYFFIKEEPTEKIFTGIDSDDIASLDLETYVFDISYFAKFPGPGEDGARVFFCLLNGTDILYLCLYNHHNGYYSHGFSMRDGGENGTPILEGRI